MKNQKSVLFAMRSSYKSTLKKKKIIKSGIINIKQLDAEELHIAYVI